MVRKLKSRLHYILLIAVLALGMTPVQAQTTISADEAVALAREKQAAGDADGSFIYIDQALPMRSFTTNFSPEKWAEVVILKAKAYAMKYDWQKAIKVGLDAYFVLKSNPKGETYAETMHSLATFYAGRGRMDDNVIAINYARMAMNQYGKRTIGYFTCVNDLAYYYMLSGYQEDAQTMAEDAIRYGTNLYAENNNTLEKLLWEKATSIAELDSREAYGLACTYALATINSMELHGDTLSNDYLRRLIKTAGYYFQRREFTNEIPILLKAAPAAKNISGENSLEYVDCLRKLALAYNHNANELKNNKKRQDEYKANWELSEQYEGLAREILINTNLIDEIRTEQIPLVSNRALELHKEGKLADAIRYETIAYELNGKYGNLHGKAHSASNLSIFNHDNKNNEASITFAREAVEMYDTLTYDNAHQKELAQLAYHTAALYFHNNKEDQSAVKYSSKSIAILEEMGDTLSKVYPTALRNMGIYYSSLGDRANAAKYDQLYQKADAIVNAHTNEQQLADIDKNVKGKKNKQKAKEELALAAQNKIYTQESVLEEWNRLVNAQEEDAIHEYYKKTIETQRNVLLQNYPELSVEKRQAAWNAIRTKDPVSDPIEYANTLAYAHAYNDSLIVDTWNAFIFDDGVADFIRTGEASRITRTWKEIHNEMEAGTLLIRFFITPTEENINPYSAFLLKKEWEKPKIVAQVFTESEVLPISFNDGTTVAEKLMSPEGRERVISDYRVGKMIWDYILKSVPDMASVTKITYKTVGMLNDLDPAELCVKANDKKMKEKYSMTRF